MTKSINYFLFINNILITTSLKPNDPPMIVVSTTSKY